MPVVQPGTYTVYFNGTFWSNEYPPGANGTAYSSNGTLYTTASVTMQASSITVTPSPYVPAGSTVSVTGQYFYPGTTVNINVYLNGTTLVASITNVPVGSNGEFTATFTAPNVQSGQLLIVAEETNTKYIAGTPPNAVGNATAIVNITNVHVVIINLLNKVLGNLTSMNATLTAVYGAVQSMSSILSTVNKAVLSVNSTVQSMNSTLSNMQ